MRFPKEDLSFTDLKIRHKKLNNDGCVFLPEGSIDSANADEFRSELDRVFQDDFRHVLLDLVGVRYLSSMGLGAIISAMQKAKEKNANFALYDSQPSVKRVLQIARLDFLELDPQKLKANDEFGKYVLDQEPQRKKLRETREQEKNKREASSTRLRADL